MYARSYRIFLFRKSNLLENFVLGILYCAKHVKLNRAINNNDDNNDK